MNGFSYQLVAKRGNSKAGVIRTPHGQIKTPTFMPVGTQGSVKSLSPQDLISCGAQIILGNTYHLYLRPGDQNIAKLGGLHQFSNWQGPILTDSGGYQVSSLGHFKDSMSHNPGNTKRSKVDDQGVTFYSHLDGQKHRITPEKSIKIQENLGADIIMAFDEATPNKGKQYAKSAMLRTHSWLKRSIKQWQKLESQKSRGQAPQALFGIIQGGNYKDLRRQSAEFVISQDLPGVAIGGGSIGQDPQETEQNTSWIRDLLPESKPFYLMGVGVNPQDIISAIESGADIFDCVAPTRLARMGQLYYGKYSVKNHRLKFSSEFKNGRLNIANARFKLDQAPIQNDCDCYTCSHGFTRAYLNHLFKAKELLYYRLASLHNVRFIIRLTQVYRQAITNKLGD